MSCSKHFQTSIRIRAVDDVIHMASSRVCRHGHEYGQLQRADGPISMDDHDDTYVHGHSTSTSCWRSVHVRVMTTKPGLTGRGSLVYMCSRAAAHRQNSQSPAISRGGGGGGGRPARCTFPVVVTSNLAHSNHTNTGCAQLVKLLVACSLLRAQRSRYDAVQHQLL
jgi:hypothetical protein